MSFSPSRGTSRACTVVQWTGESANNLMYPRFTAILPRSANDDSAGDARILSSALWPPRPIVSRVGIALARSCSRAFVARLASPRSRWSLSSSPLGKLIFLGQTVHSSNARNFESSIFVECQVWTTNFTHDRNCSRCLSRYFSPLEWSLEKSGPVACLQSSWRARDRES